VAILPAPKKPTRLDGSPAMIAPRFISHKGVLLGSPLESYLSYKNHRAMSNYWRRRPADGIP